MSRNHPIQSALEVFHQLSAALSASPWQALVLFLVLGATLLVLIYLLARARCQLRKRVRELSALTQVSQVMQSTVALAALLPVIQEQVMDILQVSSFYVALYDAQTDEIWYPLAVKAGQSQTWPRRRRMAKRLTDRVIWERETLMLTPHTQRGPNPVGFPGSEATPKAWLGVPLVTQKQTLGCIAVFDTGEGIEFSNFDVDLLTIIAGQAGIAIESALLYEQLQARATHFETLNHLTGQITASLDLGEVLTQVCRAVERITGNARSAIYLQAAGSDVVTLAHAQGLSPEFVQQNRSFSIGRAHRTRCLRSQQHNLVADVREASLPVEIALAFYGEKIRAYADFPLSTPDGPIGFLSVYYDEAHEFTPDDLNLLQTLAAQAALAVANARLHTTTDQQLARRLQQVAIVEAVGRELSAATLSENLFRLILNYALEFTQAPWGGICIYNAQIDLLEIKAKRGYDDLIGLPPTKGITGRAFRLRRVENISDISQDADYINFRGTTVRSQLSVPLLREGEALGVITLESDHPHAFSDEGQSLVEQLAHQAAVALINAQLHQETQQQQKQLEAVLNSVAEAVLMFDTDGVITLTNRFFCALTGMSAADLVAQPLQELPSGVLRHLGYDREQIEAMLLDLKREVAPEATATAYHLPDIVPKLVYERTLHPVLQTDEVTLGWMLIWRDVTDEHRLNQERETIADALIHDLRSPISAVLGSLDLLDEVVPAGEHREIVDHSLGVGRRGARRVLRLVKSLMDVARMQSGSMQLEKGPVDLSVLVQALLDDIAMLSDEYEIVLQNEVPQDLPIIFADEEKIARVIQNLIDNAVKFSPDGGAVQVRAHVAQEQLVVQVVDQGPGVKEEYRTAIFERFSQISGQFGRWRGAGLGLAFCKLAVEAHGGAISYQAPPSDQPGSIFVFTLPMG